MNKGGLARERSSDREHKEKFNWVKVDGTGVNSYPFSTGVAGSGIYELCLQKTRVGY